MIVEGVRLRHFRSYAQAELRLGPSVTVISGQNGTGKTNLLEALYFGCTGRSCRTAKDREVLRFGARTLRVEVDTAVDDGERHRLGVGFTPGEPKHLTIDGNQVERLIDHPLRPLLTVFLPERLELVKGSPALRRAHIDQFVAALWPARALTRRDYVRALAQRNALLLRIRERGVGVDALDAWEHQMALLGVQLTKDRARALATIGQRAAAIATELGLNAAFELRLRAVDKDSTTDEVKQRLESQRESDLRRGFTQSGPHRDDFVLLHGDRELKAFGSQGQQRLGLLALQLAEREALAIEHGRTPLLLLDDVMSEIDGQRRRRLLERIGVGGQTVITATEIDQIPVVKEHSVVERIVTADDGAGSRVDVC